MARQATLEGMANRLVFGISPNEVGWVGCILFYNFYSSVVLMTFIYFQDPLLFPHRVKWRKRKKLRRAARKGRELDRRPVIVAFGDADLKPIGGHPLTPIKVIGK